MNIHHLLIKAADNLEPLPQAVLQLATAVNDPENGPDELAAILSTDPNLAAHVLREANSIASASRAQIGSLDQAVVRLGAGRILEIALRGELAARFDTDLAAYELSSADRRAHAVGTSIAAEICARAAQVDLSRDVICAALLHDIGKDIINGVMNPDAAQPLRDAGLSMMEIETELVEADHAEVGALVMRSWGLPDSLIEAVRNHHQPTASSEAAVICLAEAMSIDLLPGTEHETDDAVADRATAAEILDLADRLDEIHDSVARALEAAGLIE